MSCSDIQFHVTNKLILAPHNTDKRVDNIKATKSIPEECDTLIESI